MRGKAPVRELKLPLQRRLAAMATAMCSGQEFPTAPRGGLPGNVDPWQEEQENRPAMIAQLMCQSMQELNLSACWILLGFLGWPT